MKRAILTVLAGVSLSSQALAENMATNYSQGLRMGQLVKLAEEGGFLTFGRTGEGKLLLGNESSAVKEILNSDCGTKEKPQTCSTSKETNPWNFSIDLGNKALVEKMKKLQGQYVVMKYRERHIKLLNPGATAYEVTDIEPVKPLQQSIPECKAPHNGSGWKSDGNQTGRVVKISRRGYLNKTWEVQIQVGNSGNEFVEMSVSDQKVARCLQTFLRAGQKVTLKYNEAYYKTPMGLGRDTTFDILSVKPAAELPAALPAAAPASEPARVRTAS